MEIEDPIQQLLKNTGWSCDDLLEKLQKYKSQEVTNDKESSVSAEVAEKKDTGECVVDSTREIAENVIASGQIAKVPVETNETEKSAAKVTNDVINSNNLVAEEFSDTDEEEVEVNVTNSNIINEIIDDIDTENLEDSVDTNINLNYQSEVSKAEETTEVTEVRVIEVNTDGEDGNEDNFEEENSCNVTTFEETHDSSNIEYLKTYPQTVSENIDTDTNVSEIYESDQETDSNFKENTTVVNKTVDISDKIDNSKSENNWVLGKSNLCLDKIKQNETENVPVVVVEPVNSKFDKPKVVNDKIIKSNFEDVNLTKTILPSPITDDTIKNINEDSVPENLDDIRNNLKFQLSCLRNRKKGHFFKEMRTNVVDELENTKKSISTENLNNIIAKAPCEPKNHYLESESVVINSKKDALLQIDNDSNDLYTQTNEFGLVILNVQGGIDIEEDNDESSKQKISEDTLNDNSSSNTNYSLLDNSVGCNDSNFLPEDNMEKDEEETSENGVLDEIRKIIHKQKCNFNKNKEIGSDKKVSERKKSANNFGFLSKSSEFQMNKENNRERVDTDCLSAKNSLPSFTMRDNNQIAVQNSPFISNTLDEFLGNAKLNISYNVPKCDAEEGLKISYSEESPLVLKKIVKVGNEETPKPKNLPQTIKAKTVAQMRKILEKQKKMEFKKLQRSEQTEGRIKPKIPLVDRINRDSYVLLNDKKIWVRGMTPDACIAKINFPERSQSKEEMAEVNQKQRKPSLLTDLEKKYKEVLYRPGPMSKKPGLQVNGQENWETETKLLPKVYLDVVPIISNPISPNILRRLPQCDGKLTNSRIEFALSVLKTKNDQNIKPKVFRFPLKYHNSQERIVVRKQKICQAGCIVEERTKPKTDNEIVADVIEGLIRYVEIKEIAPTLIKEEKDVANVNSDDKFAKMPTISDNVSNIIKKPYKKRSKVELELCRLNCKVVNVEIEEKVEDECYKPYCRLGCICKSLKCERGLTYHCQKVQCMLECTCPKEKSITYNKLTLPAGTDILSTDTVNRIEDEAKKDLAKVEREFTQTVIHTSDKTIIVGLGGRNKARRITKTPKKYSDYVDSFETVKEEVKVKEDKTADFFRKCVVNLEKLDLARIVPYCLIHNIYHCYCQGYTNKPEDETVIPALSKSASIKDKKIVEENVEKPIIKKRAYVSKKVRKFTTLQKAPTSVPEKPQVITSNESHHSENVSDAEKLINKRPIRNTKKIKLKLDFSYSDEVSFYSSDCARVRGVYKTDLNNRRYNIKQRNYLSKNDFTNNITDADFLKAKIYTNSANTQMLEVDLLKYFLISEAKRQQEAMSLLVENSYSEKNKHKRKQRLEIRNDDSSNLKISLNQDMAIQRRKRQLPRKSTAIEPIFEGEIIIDKRNMELLQKMGPKTVSDGYARLLPWKALIESFRKQTINIWSMVDQPSRLLINKSDKLPPKNYVNITDSTAKAGDVTLWILNNRLPPNYQEDNVSFILKQTKDNYEICGLCTKNLTEEKVSSESESSVEYPNPREIPFKHKDLNGQAQMLFLTKQKYKLQELVEENMASIGETSIGKNKLYMWAALPEIYQVCKWRMIFLNSDFTYLYFTSLKYSIKYTDLLTAGNIAKAENCTVMLRNKLIENAYNHKSFGTYFDPHYQDRLFIGPYFKQHNEDDVETLRYINKSLVCTESFNKMQGKVDYKCGHWLIERPYWGMKRRLEVEQTIDLTNEDCSASPRNKRRYSLDSSQVIKRPRFEATGESGQIIMHDTKQIRVIDGEPRKPEDFNRYIITNIPHFGYLGAYKHDNSQEIDVSWPFENKLLRFPNSTTAISFLQDRFSSLLQPIPESFKINVIILTHIDLENSHPINASILSGHYICGNFGCYNVKVIKNDFCMDKLGMTREALLRIFARRAQAFVRKKVEELADLLNIHNEIGRYDIINILDTAQNEINSQLQIEKEYVAKKNQLLLAKRELALKVFCLISALPEKEKQSENWKFKRILTNTGKPITTNTDPIEIPDSDEEDALSDNKNEILPKNAPVDDTSGKSSDKTIKLSDDAKSDKEDTEKPAKIILLSVPDGVKVPKPISPMISTLNIPSKITETSAFPSTPNLKLKSVLKSNITNSVSSRVEPIVLNEYMSLLKNSNAPKSIKITPTQPQYITGVKIVKTQSGKLMLVTDSGKTNVTGPTSGTKVVIKNNQVLSVEPIKADVEDSVSASDKPTDDCDLASESDSDSPNIDNLDTTSGNSDCISECSISKESKRQSDQELSEIDKISEKLNVSVSSSDDKNCESTSSYSILTDKHAEHNL